MEDPSAWKPVDPVSAPLFHSPHVRTRPARAPEIRLLGPERERRPRPQRHRTAHRLGYEYNKELAVLAEDNGFEHALTQVRYTASYGAGYQHESTGFSLALLLATQRLKVIAAIHPGLWHPGVLAKFVASADVISGGRAAINVVSGWFTDEFTKLGEPWHEHDERYRRTEEFIRTVRELSTDDHASFSGDFYRVHDFDIKPKAVPAPGRPHPEIFQGGNSTAARGVAGRVSDWYFSNGKDYDGFSEQVSDVRAHAAGRTVRFGLNGFVIARDTAAEAEGVLREIVEKANVPAVEGFRAAVAQARQVDGRLEGHVGGLGVQGPGAVQRRVPHAAGRQAGTHRGPGARVQKARGEPVAAQVLALLGGCGAPREDGAADHP